MDVFKRDNQQGYNREEGKLRRVGRGGIDFITD